MHYTQQNYSTCSMGFHIAQNHHYYATNDLWGNCSEPPEDYVQQPIFQAWAQYAKGPQRVFGLSHYNRAEAQ